MEKVKEFEKAAIEAVSGLRNAIGATRINIEIRVDDYEKGCKTDISYFTSIPQDAARCPGNCKGD